MNRRNILSLSAITALGLALLPGSAVAQQAADTEGVKAASKAFYTALAVLTVARQWRRCGLIRLTSHT